MSDLPPWFAEGSNALAIGASVLPVGRHTCPSCQAESDGGDPESWSEAVTHAQLITLNEPLNVTVTISGTFDVDWERIEITESGDAASCAKKITHTTGRSGTVEFEFPNSLSIPRMECLPIATGIGVLANVASEVAGAPQTDSLAITDNVTGAAICSSTGCTSGDFGEYNHDSTGVLEAENVDGAFFAEKFCRTGENSYRYTFTGEARVTLSEGGYVKAYLYAGAFDWARWGGEPAELSDPEYSFTAEEDADAVGAVRGVAIKARYLTFIHDHAASIVSGSPNNCPFPAYSSDVTTGTTTGTISVLIA